MDIALVNTNRIVPPIAPIGIDYLAETLAAAGHSIGVLDLCGEEDTARAIERFFAQKKYHAVGVSFRNTDDCVFSRRQSFIPDLVLCVSRIKKYTGAAPILLGGAGFSAMPEYLLKATGADAGIWGDGEVSFKEFVSVLATQSPWSSVPNLVWHQDGRVVANKREIYPVENLPLMSRTWVDNKTYFKKGGQIGIETKRGCPGRCIYCADPLIKGNESRMRDVHDVCAEIEQLVDRGIDVFHICDSEFNLPEEHAAELCREICRRKLGNTISWYAYGQPKPFSIELARLLKAAGCAGINFGVDSGDETMLKRLRRSFLPGDIIDAVDACSKTGIAVMCDLLLGAPGETDKSITRTVELMKRARPDCVGTAVGVRVYPGTELWQVIQKQEFHEGLIGERDGFGPLFFIEPKIQETVFQTLDTLIAGDKRFFFHNPDEPGQNYNYNANSMICEAILQGYKGAYWDILRKYK